MQVFGNVGSVPEVKLSKSGKRYSELRLCESQKGIDTSPTWYSCRIFREEPLLLNKGDFVRITGKLKVDFYLSREGKPTGTLLIIAFEAQKIAKPEQVVTGSDAKKVEGAKKELDSVAAKARIEVIPAARAPVHTGMIEWDD